MSALAAFKATFSGTQKFTMIAEASLMWYAKE